MLLDSIAITDFPAFSKFDREFNRHDSSLTSFVKWPATISHFKDVIQARQDYVTDRRLLYDVFSDQYSLLSDNKVSHALISSLLSEETYTVVTAHQPCLFTGPAFVISKAISTIKLATQIQNNYPQYKILPVFVIGSEDHDVEELNHCYLFGQKITWPTDQKGPVGRYSLDTIGTVLDQVTPLLRSSKHGEELIPLLKKAYNSTNTFAQAFQVMLHEILGPLGILILNTDDSRIKQSLKPIILSEVTSSASKPLVQKTQVELKSIGYDPAAFVRDINFFYFGNGFRDRIEKKDGIYSIIGQDKNFTEQEMKAEIEVHPEHFSPNVIMRPLCQEIILPNLAYVGGGGELSYWIERRHQFETLGIPYPMLVRRDSFMILQQEQLDQLKYYKLTLADLAARPDLLINKVTESLSTSSIQLGDESKNIMEWMDHIRIKAEAIDKTLGPNVEGEKSKILKAIEGIEKKMLKAEKLKLEVQLNKVKKLQEKLMPDQGLVERKENFMTFYSEYGADWTHTLLQDFNPLDGLFKAVQVNSQAS